jgi:phospho-N-acetylmuramoyl-pentapeptide-transferase
MLYWLHELFPNSYTNVLQYVTFRGIVGGLLAFLLVLLIGNKVICKLVSMKLGQPIRTAEEVNALYALHEGKKGIPTMGGFMILLTFVLATLLFTRFNNPLVWAILIIAIGYGALGWVDDYAKIKRRNSKGVSSRFKLVWQFSLAALVGWLIFRSDPSYFGQLWVPFVKTPLLPGLGVWMILIYMLVIAGASNAVNVTDGLDGLAAGCTLPVAFCYSIFNYVTGHAGTAKYLLIPHHANAAEAAVICLILMGACMGFLWFNCAPARVFMGDTGSLAIGGIVGVVAIACKQELTLLLVGAVFVLETISVMIQVAYFKHTRKIYGEGRRFFRMAPFHHHLELKGWKETQIVVRFWIIGIVCALVGIATLKLR